MGYTTQAVLLFALDEQYCQQWTVDYGLQLINSIVNSEQVVSGILLNWLHI